MKQYATIQPHQKKESVRENFPLELTCGAEEKDVGVSEELIQFVRHMRLSVRDRAEAVLVLLAQVRINVVKQQGKRRAPESLDLRHENGISCCRSNVTRSANLWPICAFFEHLTLTRKTPRNEVTVSKGH